MEENSLKLQIGNVHNIGKRESQQDSFGVSDISNLKLSKEKGVFAVVADGMGGLAGGAETSAIVTTFMLNYFSRANDGKNTQDQLLDMLFGANSEVRRYLNINNIQHSGSTVVAVIIKDMALDFLTVGDSRLYLFRGGNLLLLNREHTYGSELDEKAARGELSLDEARNDPQRSALTSYIGMEEIAHIDRSLRSIPLQKGDRVFLMSDGIFGTISDEEIASVAALDIYETVTSMENAIKDKGKRNQDNYTSVIIEIK